MPRPMQLEDLFRLRAVHRPAISPDGRRIVFECKRFDFDENKNFTNLMVADVATGRVRALTSGKHIDIRAKWSHDGREIAFISDRDKGNCLFILPMDGGERRRITEPDGFVQDFDWSPDGKRLVYTYQAMSERERLERDGKDDLLKKRPQFKHITRLHHKLDGSGWWNGEYAHVYVISADGGKPKALTSGEFDHAEPRFSPDGKWISFVSNRNADRELDLSSADVWITKPSGGVLKNLTRNPGSAHGHAWSPDGKTIAYIGDGAPPGRSCKHLEHVWLADVAGGKPRELTREIDNNCVNLSLGDVSTASFEVCPIVWSGDSRRVYFIVSEFGAAQLYSRAIDKRDLRCEVSGDINVFWAQRTAATGPIVLAIGTATDPGEVYAYDAGDASATAAHAAPSGDLPHSLTLGVRTATIVRASNVNTDVLAGIQVAAPEPMSVKSGAVEVHGWVLHPPGFDSRKKYPAILQIHGGPHAQYAHCFFHELQWIAAQGYVVVYGNPRGSVGYGLDFQGAIFNDWGNLDYKDVMRLADWLFARPYVDKQRVGVTGGSYGGFMTNWLIGHTDRFRAAVTQRCVSNMESMFGTSDFGYDLGHEFGGKPWERREAYRRQSPLTYVTKMNTPLLIEHEEQDHRCPIEQAEQLFTALKVLGKTVEFVRFEGESHGLCRMGRPQNRAERLRRIMDWFKRYMK
ncbi:MAG: S9 family peptidase [Phycisphaerae bacterium]